MIHTSLQVNNTYMQNDIFFTIILYLEILRIENIFTGNYTNNAFSKKFAIAGNDGKHVLVCSRNGGILYRMSTIKNDIMENVLELKGHKMHLTCTDWSASNDCGPCVTAGFDGKIRLSTMLNQ